MRSLLPALVRALSAVPVPLLGLVGLAGLAGLLGLAVPGCSGDDADGRLYAGRGIVRGVLADDGQLMIEHGDIEDLMPAMTMNFEVADPALLGSVEPGQVVDFALRKHGRRYVIVGLSVIDQAEIGPEGALGRLADVREPAPGFALVDTEGEPVTLESLRGRAVLLDFIFTHCPGPCPIQTGILAQVQRELPEDLRARTRFVSITLDPARDTPEALRAYARARGADLSGWSFLSGSAGAIDPILAAYGVGRTLEAGGDIEHTLATFLIDPEGRIRRRYVGLGHDPEVILRDLAALLRS